MNGPVLVGLDALPPSDEARVARQVRALRRMWSSGASVVLSLVPEGAQLLEALPECKVLRAPQLLCSFPEPSPDAEARSLTGLTRGIPSLAASLGAAALEQERDIRPSAAYLDALGELLASSVRATLSDEECRARLGMLLLGAGTRDDLARVVGEVHNDVLEGICANAPLFGVRPDLTGFSCLTADDDMALRVCMRRLDHACALYPEVPAAAMRLLVGRGDYARAAALGVLSESEGVCELVVERGAAFLDEGEVDLVRHALARPDCPRGERAEALLDAVRALSGRGGEGTEIAGVSSRGSACLIADAHRFLEGAKPLYDLSRAPLDDLERRLRTHAEACALMRDGRFTKALRRLASAPGERRPATVSGALLAVDEEMARLMTGGEPREDAIPEDARELLRRRAMRGLAGYLAMEQMMEAALLGGDTEGTRAQALVARAERSGSAMVQVIALVAGSVLDLREGSVARAHVRASLASSIATGMGATYFTRVATLLKSVAHYLMGGQASIEAGGCEDDLDAVSALVRAALLEEAGPLSDEDALPDEVPWNALWLLRLLLSDMGELSDLVARRLPPSWRRALGEGAGGPSRSSEERDADRRVELGAAPRDDAPLRLELLGGFSLRVRGVLVADWKIERRNAKPLLEYLVLQHGSGTKRFRLVEQVWPDCDYVKGFSRAYQATSVLRRAIAEIDPDLDPFVASRTTREISLDMGLVSCDVDEFRRSARAASDSLDDERALEQALRAEGLYEGDLYLPPVDATGFVAGVRRELRDLYADAMVAGAEAATRLGRERTGVRLAREAVAVDDLREDAVVALVRALRACGRSVEADRQSEGFSARLARERRGRRGARRVAEGPDGASGAGETDGRDGGPAPGGALLV